MAANLFPPESPEDVLDQIIASYVEALDSGQAPDRDEWLRRYPEAASGLAAFFEDQDCMVRRAAPLRECVSGCLTHDPESFPRPGTRLGDYELLEEISRGGMGIVFKARQVHLNRLVALKMILSGSFASPAELHRFRLEAEAAANLDHPNIVPLYEIDTWQSQPFFSMRLIEGGSLATAMLTGQWKVAQKGNHPQAARLLATVARAVHYAHQRGILHRDLKPGNILLDREGNPHVTDFGLAKWVGRERGEAKAEGEGGVTTAIATQPRPSLGETTQGMTLRTPLSAVFSVEGGAGPLTHTGMALGTPSYMSPEQARAKNEPLTTAADVYSLGAILYELLTGRPPFREESVLGTLQAVFENPPTPPRHLNPNAPRDLEIICLKCLEKDPARRYASAAALADDLECYMRGEPIEARPMGRLGRLWRWCRRQPALASAAALAIVGLVSASVISLLYAASETRGRERLDDANTKLGTALDQANKEKIKADEQKSKAEDNARKVTKALEERDANYLKAYKAIEFFFLRFTQDVLSQIPGQQSLHKEFMAKALISFQDFLKQKGDNPALRSDVANTYIRVGDITSQLGDKKEALVNYDKGLELFTELREADPKNLNLRTGSAVAYLNRGVVLIALARQPDALVSYEKALDLYRSVQRDQPKNAATQYSIALTLSNLANTHRNLAQFDKAQDRIREAQKWLGPLLKQYPGKAQYESELARTYVNLGVILNVLGKGDEALEMFEMARELEEKLAKNHPNNRQYQHVLAINYRRLSAKLLNRGKTADGLLLLDKSKVMLDQLIQANPDVPGYLVDWANTVRHQGDSHRIRKELDKAQACYQEIYNRLDKLNARFEGVATFQDELALACLSMSRIPLQQKDADKALVFLQRCRKLRERLVADNPIHLDYRQELVWALILQGQAMALKGKLDETVSLFRLAIEHEQHNVRIAPQVPEYSRNLRGHYEDLVKTLKEAKRTEDVLRTWRDAHAFFESIVREQAQIPELCYHMCRALVLSGQDLRAYGRGKDSLQSLNEARENLEKLVAHYPKNYLPELAHCHFQIGLTHSFLKENLPEQIRQYETACNLQTDYVENYLDYAQSNSSLGTFLHNLALAHHRNGDIAAAETLLRKAIHHQRKALDDPKSRLIGVRQILSNSYRSLTEILLKADKNADAVAVTLERQPLWDKQPTGIFLVACDLGRCANALGEKRAEQDRVAELGLQVLRQALTAGFRDWKELAEHPDLRLVRALPGYPPLLREFKK